MVTATLALLLGLAIYVGLRWQLRSLPTYFVAVVGTLAIWGSTLAFRNSYTVMLPLVLGSLASLLLALVGVRGALVAASAGDGTRAFWIAGTCAVLAPFVLVIGAWLW